MIKFYLYCSYSGSAVGYQMTYADRNNREVIHSSRGVIPDIISDLWTHSGASFIAGQASPDMNYVVIKNIDYTNPQKQLDMLGRKVYMNCAITGGADDALDMKYLTEGFLKCYNAAAGLMCDMLELCRSRAGYTVDFDKLERLLASCLRAGKHSGLGFSVNFDKKVTAVALDADWAYFCEQNKVNKFLKPSVVISLGEYKALIAQSENSFGDESAEIPTDNHTENTVSHKKTHDGDKSSDGEYAREEAAGNSNVKADDELTERLKASEKMADELKERIYNAEEDTRRLASELSKSKIFGAVSAALIAALAIALIVLIIKIIKGV